MYNIVVFCEQVRADWTEFFTDAGLGVLYISMSPFSFMPAQNEASLISGDILQNNTSKYNMKIKHIHVTIDSWKLLFTLLSIFITIQCSFCAVFTVFQIINPSRKFFLTS